MANEVATMGGLGSLAKGLKRSKTTRPSLGGKAYLKFGKDGAWTLGVARDERNGETVIFNPLTIRTGYVCIDSGPNHFKVLGEVMQGIAQGPVDPGELDDSKGGEWKYCIAVEGRFQQGAQAEFQYNTSSYGGIKALDPIMDMILDRIEAGETAVCPIVRLEDDWYDHPTWKKTYEPILTVAGWADIDGVSEDTQAVEDKSEAPAEAPDAEEEAPVRRRRR